MSMDGRSITGLGRKSSSLRQSSAAVSSGLLGGPQRRPEAIIGFQSLLADWPRELSICWSERGRAWRLETEWRRPRAECKDQRFYWVKWRGGRDSNPRPPA